MTLLFTISLLGLLYLHFLRHGDYSALSLSRWGALLLVAVVLPHWWGVKLDRTLRHRGVALTLSQQLMPGWCAGAAALLATNLFR